MAWGVVGSCHEHHTPSYMKGRSFILFITFALSSHFLVSSQGVVYFNDTEIDKEDICISRTLQGVSVSTELVNMLPVHAAGNYPLGVSYFREDRIAPTLSMYTSGGLQNMFERTRAVYVKEGNVYEVHTDTRAKTYYNLGLQVGTELRWYFSYRHRYMDNRRLDNHTGWFLSVPFVFTVNLLHQPDGVRIQQWQPESFMSNLSLTAGVGYRYSVGRHWLLEAALAYKPFTAYFNGGNNTPYVVFSGEINEMFDFAIKTAYVF